MSPDYVNKSNQLEIRTKFPHVIRLDYNLMCSVTSPCEPEVGFDVAFHLLVLMNISDKALKPTMAETSSLPLAGKRTLFNDIDSSAASVFHYQTPLCRQVEFYCLIKNWKTLLSRSCFIINESTKIVFFYQSLLRTKLQLRTKTDDFSRSLKILSAPSSSSSSR